MLGLMILMNKKNFFFIIIIVVFASLVLLAGNSIQPAPDQWAQVQSNFFLGTNEFIQVSGTGDGSSNSLLEISTSAFVKLTIPTDINSYSTVYAFIIPEIFPNMQPHDSTLNVSLLQRFNLTESTYPNGTLWGMKFEVLSNTSNENAIIGQWYNYVLNGEKVPFNTILYLYIVQTNVNAPESGRSLYIDLYEIIIHQSDHFEQVLANWLDRKPIFPIVNFLESSLAIFKFSPDFQSFVVQLISLVGVTYITVGQILMITVGLILLYLAINKEIEPILLLPIGFGAILVNIPLAGMMDPYNKQGILYLLYATGILTELFPILIFIGIGAMADFGPLLERPKMMIFGAAGQIGIFFTLLVALVLQSLNVLPVLRTGFALKEAASIAIIGAADGPSAIYLTTLFAPQLLGPIVIAAYSYMSLVPIIQPPIMKALTTKKERAIRMDYTQREISRRTRILFPITVTLVTSLIAPLATPLIGSLMLGNLLRESGVVARLKQAAENEIPNTVTLLLGISIGATMNAQSFLSLQTIIILLLGVVAFITATAGGVLLGKVYCHLSGMKINPLIGACGISAFPMSARVVASVAKEEDPENFLIFHAIASNTAGQIGSVIATGMLLLLVPVFAPLLN